MAAGDVNSRLRFDTRQFNTGLTAGQKRLETFGEAGVRIFERLTQVAQQFQGATQNLKLPEIRPNVTVNIKDTGISTYRAEVDGASVSVAGLDAETGRLGDTATKVRPKLEGAGAGAEAVGRGSDSAVAGVDRLHNAMDRLQQVAAILISGAGLRALYRTLEGSANTSQEATVGLNLYNRELAKANETGEDGQAVLDRLGDRFKVNTTSIAGDAAGILRYGANLSQTEEILLRSGASAVIRGRNFAAGSNAASEALNGEYSAVLNLIGVSGNLSTYFQRMAKEQKTSVDQLTRAQKVEAFLNLLRAETGTELEALSDIYIGYGAAVQRVSNSQTTAAQETGTVVIPVLTVLKNAYADLLDLYNALPRPVQALAVGTATLGVVTGALVVGYISLRGLLLNQRTLGPIILDALKNETVARSRLGTVILGQAQAYRLLDKSQLESATKSVAAARASAGAVGKLGALRAALTAPLKGGLLLELGALVFVAREATKYFGVMKPVVDTVLASFANTGIDKFVTSLSGAVAGGQLFVTVFKNSVLYTVTALSLTLEELNFQYERSMLVAQKWGQQTRFDGEGAAATQRQIDGLKTAHEENKNAIFDSASAYETQNTNVYLAAAGLEEYASSTELAADGTRKLTTEAAELRDKFKERLGALKLEVDTSTLKGQITEATEELDTLITDLRAEIEKLPLGDVLRSQLEGFLKTAQNTRQAQIGKVYAQALTEAEEEASDATLSAMQDGAAKIEAQRERDRDAADKAFAERTEGLKTNSARYQEFLALYNQQIAAIEGKAATDLQAQAQERLNAARELREQIDQVAADLAQSQTEGSDDALVGIRAQFARNADGIRADTQKLLRDVEQARQQRTISGAEAAAETVRISNLQTARLGQNERELSEAVQAETRRRANFVADQYSAIRSYEAAYTAERQRSQDDELGAVKTELGERLRLIDEGLRRELQQEGLTRAQITAITQKAEADRVQARVEAGRQIDNVMRDEVARERAFQNELRSVRQQDTIDAAQGAGQVRAAAVAEYEKSVSDLQASLAEQLAAVGVSETGKTEIRRVAQAKREALDASYGRTLAKLAEDEAQVVAAAAETAQRTRIDAVTGSLPRLIRQFGLEQAARLKADREALDAFEGTQQQRQQLVAATAQREAAYAKKLAVDLLKEQRAALQAYQTAYLEAETQIREARETSAQEALTAAQKVTDFGGQRLDRRAFRDEQGAYDALQKTLQANVQGSAEVADAARVRARSASATADDVGALVAAENAYVAAQGRVVDATQAQIDRLKGLQNAQFEIVRGGSDVLAFADAASKITGRDPERGRITTFINEQQDALVSVLQQQERNNVPLREQLATLQEIAGLEDRLRQSGQRGLSAEQVTYIDERQAELLSSYPGEAAKALQSSADIGQQLRTLSTELGDAQEKFTTLLGSVSQSSVLELVVQIDDREIRAGLLDAQTALQETFGEAAAARISERFAAGLSLGQILKTETDSATSRVRAQFDEAGGASGKGFMAAFAEGISGSGNLVEQALERVLRPVRELLPSSDAKRGPLSDLTFSGGKTVTTYAGGLERKLPDLARVVTKMAATVKPLSAVSTLQLLPGTAGASGGGGGDQHNYYLGDGMIPVDDLTRMDGARFGNSLMHTLKNRTRMGHRPPLRGGRRF